MKSTVASGTGINDKAKMAEFSLWCKKQREAKRGGGGGPARQVVNKAPEVEVIAADGALSREGALCDRLIRRYLFTAVAQLFPNNEGISNKVIYDQEVKKLASGLRGELRVLFQLNSPAPSRRKSKSHQSKVRKVAKLIDESLIKWRELVREAVRLKKRDLIVNDLRFVVIYNKRETEFFTKYVEDILVGYTTTTDKGACNLQDLVERIGVSRKEYIYEAGTKLITLINGTTNYIHGKEGECKRLMCKITEIKVRFAAIADPAARGDLLEKCRTWEATINGFASIQPKKAEHIQAVQGMVDNRGEVTPFDESKMFEASVLVIARLFRFWCAFINDEQRVMNSVSQFTDLL